MAPQVPREGTAGTRQWAGPLASVKMLLARAKVPQAPAEVLLTPALPLSPVLTLFRPERTNQGARNHSEGTPFA